MNQSYRVLHDDCLATICIIRDEGKVKLNYFFFYYLLMLLKWGSNKEEMSKTIFVKFVQAFIKNVLLWNIWNFWQDTRSIIIAIFY